MINLTYKFNQDSTSLELAGMPDVSNGDSEITIGIISSWTLKIIGSPQLEGQKEHLDDLMQVILQYSRLYISGIRQTFTSNKKIVTISPMDIRHKLQLKSTQKDIKPLEIIIDDSELSDLTRCLDLLRFDPRFNIKWDIHKEQPLSRKLLHRKNSIYKNNLNFFYAITVFLFTSLLLLFIPIKNKVEFKDAFNNSQDIPQQIDK